MECLGEGNGTPLQYSCLETPMDGGAWWAAVYGVAQSRTRLKRLSSSSNIVGLEVRQCWYRIVPFPMVYPFLHSLNKVSCNRHSNAGIDKISLLQEYKIQPHVC